MDNYLSFEVPNPYVNLGNVNISSVNNTVENYVSIRSEITLERFSSLTLQQALTEIIKISKFPFRIIKWTYL